MTKLTVDFRNFANVPKKQQNNTGSVLIKLRTPIRFDLLANTASTPRECACGLKLLHLAKK
jgi:hypothetical protein